MKEDICQFETSNCPSTQYTFCRDSTGCTYRVIGRADCQLVKSTYKIICSTSAQKKSYKLHAQNPVIRSMLIGWCHTVQRNDKAWIIETNFCFIINVQEAEGG
ncbi:hypothetical protein WUBG_04951 [Wuchereria bancrofti]|uniref:Uncharacterized protein n=1 Tax=Wuchereria bancrofti TaxID=6293 RepID=J9EPN3_WUCBA|nr:hypothetical protein WUBG_04951 [Wuchereria bancrofti]